MSDPKTIADVQHAWACDYGGDEPSQVYPIGDLRPHTLKGSDCWCKPEILDGIVIHNAMDGREAFESGERVPS